MIYSSHFLLAQTNPPLFGSQWLALFAVLGGVAGFMALIAVAGQWLARTHPQAPAPVRPVPAPAAAPSVPAQPEAVPSEVLAIIAAAVAVTVGPRARIAAVLPVKPPSVEMLMQQWSVEGRRQIYSSHQIR